SSAYKIVCNPVSRWPARPPRQRQDRTPTATGNMGEPPARRADRRRCRRLPGDGRATCQGGHPASQLQHHCPRPASARLAALRGTLKPMPKSQRPRTTTTFESEAARRGKLNSDTLGEFHFTDTFDAINFVAGQVRQSHLKYSALARG